MMRKSTFASLASVAFAFSTALAGCQVGDAGDGGGGGGGDDDTGTPDAGGNNNTPDAPQAATPCPPDVATFKSEVFDVAFASQYLCVGCHGGGAGGFTLTANDQAANLAAATAEAKKLQGGKALLLLKPTGQVTHAGGTKYAADSAEAEALEKFISQVDGSGCN